MEDESQDDECPYECRSRTLDELLLYLPDLIPDLVTTAQLFPTDDDESTIDISRPDVRVPVCVNVVYVVMRMYSCVCAYVYVLMCVYVLVYVCSDVCMYDYVCTYAAGC